MVLCGGVKEGDQYEEPYVTGPEIQIMDNEYPDGVKAGSFMEWYIQRKICLNLWVSGIHI